MAKQRHVPQTESMHDSSQTLPRLGRWEIPILAAIAPLLLWPGPWSLVGLTAIGALWVCRRAATGRFSCPSGLDLPIALFLLLALLGLAVSPDTAGSLAAFYRLALGVAFFYALVNEVSGQRRARLVAAALCWGGIALGIVALLATDWDAVRLFPLPVYPALAALSRYVGWPEFFNPRIVGMALGTLVPAALAFTSLCGRRIRLLAGVSALWMAAVWVLTQSLQVLPGLAAGLLVLAAWSSRRLLGVMLLGLAIVGLVALWALDLHQVALQLLSVDHPLGIAVVLRLDMWARALAILRDMPYTGVGLDAFPLIQTHLYPGMYVGPEPHAHNLYLQIALDMGLGGLVCFLWMIGRTAWRIVETVRRHPRGESTVLLAGCSAGLASFLVSGVVDTLWSSRPALVFWILLGVAAALCRPGAQGDPDRRAGRVRVVVGTVIPMVLLAIGLLAFPARRTINWGLVQAQAAVIRARSGAAFVPGRLGAAAEDLERGLATSGGSPEVWRTLGSVYGWLGDDVNGLECLRTAMALDLVDPSGRYAPFDDWRRDLSGEAVEEPWRELLRIYDVWRVRFPRRAEAYAQVAQVWELLGGDAARARLVLEQGLEHRARPEGLLFGYLTRLQHAAAQDP